MKNEMNEMNEMPTPETTFRYETDKYTSAFSAYENMRDNAIDLGRRLTIAREALDKLARLGNEPNFGYSEGNIIAFNALARTLPNP